jgi:glycosidase
VIYSVYVRSFSPEGTFKGVEQRLDHIQSLGVTTIWLLPIHPVGAKHRKGTLGSPYSIRDFHGINPEFGTLDDFKSLLKAAHARGMKLVIDLVANHTAWDSDLIAKHPDWYARDDKGQMRPPVPDWSDVAQLDYSKPELRRYMIDMMLYWVRDVGIDGFRCDVAGMVPNDFWVAARQELDAVKPVMMLAEDDQPLQHLAAFDITYDWHTYDHLGRLLEDKLTADAFRNLLTDEGLLYPQGSLRMRFSSNHDKNAWVMPAITRYGADGAKLAAALSYALPGVPLIYNGQEAANPLKLSLFEKVAIDWSADALGLTEHYRALSRLHRERVSLRRGACVLLPARGSAHILAIRRGEGADATFALFNLSNQPQEARFADLAPELTTLIGATSLATDPAGTRVQMKPMGWWFGKP